MSWMVLFGTPNFLSVVHRLLSGTELYTFLRSMMVMKIFSLCSQDFSTSCRTVKVIFLQLHSFLNPHCDSGNSSSPSHNSCSRSCRTLATTFPTTSSRVIPLQLSHLLKSLFFGMGTNNEIDKSLRTQLSFHTFTTSSSKVSRNYSSQLATLIISRRMPELPPVFSLLILQIAVTSTSLGGGSAICGLSGLYLPCQALLV